MTATSAEPRPTPEHVLDVVRDSIAVVCELPPGSVRRAASLADLGVDSLALVEVADMVEERLRAHQPSLHIGDDDLAAFRTVADAVDYLVARL